MHISSEKITQYIHNLRGQKVMLDNDLAKLYGVTTKQLNQQVKRNQSRFPSDFMFQLTAQEKNEVVTICDHLKHLKFSPTLPYAFSEQGIAMLSSVLHSEQAIQVNIGIMRTFVQLRKMTMSHRDLVRKLKALERKYDSQFSEVFDAINELMAPPEPKSERRLGFRQNALRSQIGISKQAKGWYRKP